jgi:acid phosphatase family membrane protein YuiD
MLDNENAETLGWPSLSFLTTGGLTTSGSSTSSSFTGSGAIGTGLTSKCFICEFSTVTPSASAFITVCWVVVVVI